MVSVADVSTAVDCVEQPAAQQTGHRQRRHPQARRAMDPRIVLVVEPHHVGAVGDRRAERRQDPRRGVAMSASAATASVRAAAAFGSPGDGVDRPSAPRSRRRAARSGRWPTRRRGGRCGPACASWIADVNVAAAASRRCASSGSTSRATRRDATPSAVADSSRGGHAGDPVDQFVGLVDDEQVVLGQHGGVGDGVDGQQRVVGDDDVGRARALARAFSAKQSVPNGQRAAPMHSRADTLTCAHDRSGTPGVSSSRSPVSVSDAHSVSRCTSRPSAVVPPASNSSSCGRSSPDRPPSRCESCSGTGSFRDP